MAVAAPDPQTDAASKILVVDDERSMRELLAIVLKREGHDVLLADNGRSAVELLEREPIELLISDIRMPDMTGVEVLGAAQRLNPDIIGIMITAYASTDTAVEALRLGAYDYVSKPFSRGRIEAEGAQGARAQAPAAGERAAPAGPQQSSHQFSNIIGKSAAMEAVFQLVETIAPTTSTVLDHAASPEPARSSWPGRFISTRRGRTGRSSRSTAARCPRRCSSRSSSATCAGPSPGAETNKKGLVEVADKGTIFLDEIGEMTAMMQVKLLRVLQERKFRRVGGTDEIEADIRIIAATNRDLSRMVAEGKFREDLFYRINVIPVRLPPLRERTDDIPLLTEHFLAKYATQMDKRVTGVAADAVRCLQLYPWPGNIRELENAIERAVALERSTTIRLTSLPEHIQRGTAPGATARDAGLPDSGFDLEQHVQEIEREYLAEALRRANGVKSRAAELLGMSFRQFRYLSKKYNLK